MPRINFAKTKHICTHTPEHGLWRASDGDYAVCKMVPRHLRNAIKLSVETLRVYRDSQLPEEIDGWDGWIMYQNLKAALALLLAERNRRITQHTYYGDTKRATRNRYGAFVSARERVPGRHGNRND